METPQYAKISKILLWVLMILSVVVPIWGWVAGFGENDGAATDLLLYWTYGILGIALVAVVCLGLYVEGKANPKGLVKIGISVACAIGLFCVAYVLASGAPALGYSGAVLPSETELKLTDTILNLAYIVGGAAILSIIFGEIVMGIRNKK